jgi:biopolymer transport protein ExbB
MRAGGLLAWPILLIGALALVLVLERLVVLWRLRANADALSREARQALDAGRVEECRAICRHYRRNPAAAVLAAGLAHAGQGAEALENAFREAILRQMPQLERFLPTLSVLGAVAPLLGLLGTVTGMISTFRALTTHGSGQPGLLSGGISEALITTQLGLAVAIPVLLLHHFLERRVERLADEMEATAIAFTTPLLGTEPPA